MHACLDANNSHCGMQIHADAACRHALHVHSANKVPTDAHRFHLPPPHTHTCTSCTPTSTSIPQAVKDELCSGGAVSSLALATAEATAARLAQCYAAAPHYDVSGQEAAEADSVLHLCPLIRRALDID